MSNESSASETTPLRWPQSQLSGHDLDLNVANKTVTQLSQTAIEIGNNNNYNNANEDNLRQLQAHNSSPNNLQPHNNNNNNSNSSRMDTNKRILCRVGLDVLILLCVGFPILLFFLVGEPYQRGFFCDDESLKYPFKESTVKSWMLYIIGLVIPVSVILTVELLISNQKAKNSNGNAAASRRYVFMQYEIPDWLLECYKKIGIFGFGAAVSQVITDVAKYSIGRLRPHFIAVCQPLIDGNKRCGDDGLNGKYIQDFECQGAGSSPRMLKEMRLSFPSGHSSFTFYTMVYVALYLQARMTWQGSRLLRHFLQFLFIIVAWYTALSRVSDYKHHWSDVLVGSAIGALCALVVANFVSDLFQKPSKKPSLLQTTQGVVILPPSSVAATTN